MSIVTLFTQWFLLKPKSTKQLYPIEQNLYTFDKRTPDLLIEANKMLVLETATVLQRNKEDMDTLIMPIIRYVAEYTMLLTASQSYHHKEAGSYFYHLLETANIAARLSTNNPKLLFDVAMEHRSLYSRMYPLCAWLSGILHDIAKPLSDFQIHVYDKNRRPIDVKQLWQPDEETLWSYLLRYRASYYRVLYLTDKQYTMHEMQQMLFIKRFIEFFPVHSQERLILKKILPLTLDKTSPIYQITKKADMESTRRDTLRYTPYPILKNLSKAFVDTFQDFDRIYRVSGDTNLPYYFSPIGIHIRYPDGMHALIQQVHQKYAQHTKKPIPTDPDAWAQMLGSEHNLLIPNHASDIYRNANFPEIIHFIYLINVDLPTGNAQERVVTLSYEAVNLDTDKGTHFYQAKFATQQQSAVLANSPTSKASTPKVRAKTSTASSSTQSPDVSETKVPKLPTKNKKPNKKTPTKVKEPQSADISLNSDKIENSEPSDISENHQQVLAVAPPPVHKTDSTKVAITSDALNAMLKKDRKVGIPTSPTADPKDDAPSQDAQLAEPHTAYFPPCKQQKTPSLTIQVMANAIPHDHVVIEWGNTIEAMRTSYALQIKLLLLLEDINQHSAENLLYNQNNYHFTENGFGVNSGFFDQLIKLSGTKFCWSIAFQKALVSQSNEQEAIPEIRSAMFSTEDRRDLIFTQSLAKVLLRRYRHILKPKISLGEISI